MNKNIISLIGVTAILYQGSMIISSSIANAADQNTYGRIVIGHSQKCLDVPNGSLDDNIPLNQFQCDNSPEQSFALVNVGGGYYSIMASHSGKCLDVPNAMIDDNIPINQTQCDNSPEQSFKLTPVGNDYYTIAAKHSGKCINVWNGSNDDNAAITQQQCNNQQSQMFWFAAGPTNARAQQNQQAQQQLAQQQQAQRLAQQQQAQQQLAQQQQAQRLAQQQQAQRLAQQQAQQQLAQQQQAQRLAQQQQAQQQQATTGGAISMLTERFNVSAETQAVAISPDSSRMASGGWDNQVTVWDASGATLVKALTIPLQGKGDLLLDLAFSPDGKRIVTGSRQNGSTLETTVHVWDAYTGAELLFLQGAPSEFCNSVAYEPKGLYIAAGCFNQTSGKRTVYLWAAARGGQMQAFDGVTGPVVFSPDGTRLTSGDFSTQTLKLWDMNSGNLALTIQGSNVGGFLSAAFSSDSGTILTGNGNGSISIWSTQTGQSILNLPGHTKSVNAVAVSPDDMRFVTAGDDGSLILWDGSTGQKLSTYQGTKSFRTVSFSKDSKHIVAGGDDNMLRVFSDGAVASATQSGTLLTQQQLALQQAQHNLAQQQLAQQQQAQRLAQQQLAQQQAASAAANITQYPVATSTRAYLLYNDTGNKIFFETYDPTRGTWMPTSLDPRMHIEIVALTSGSGGLQARVETQGKGFNQYGMDVGGSYRLYANPQTGKWDIITIQAPNAAAVAAAQQQAQQLAQQQNQQQLAQQQNQQQAQQLAQQQQLKIDQLQQDLDEKKRQDRKRAEKNTAVIIADMYRNARLKHEQAEKNKPLPAFAALHIEYVVANRVSSGTDGYTSILFGGLDIAMSKAAKLAGGFGGALTVGVLRSQGISFNDLLGSSIIAGDDDLAIWLNNTGQWPPAWTGSDSVSISSGQKIPVHMSWNLPTNRAFHIELQERDTGSPNDHLGFIRFPVGSLRPGFSEEYVLYNKSENSVYTVKVFVTNRLADERNGYVQASKWHNNKAYCFAVYGCN